MVDSEFRIRNFRCRYANRKQVVIIAAAALVLCAPKARANIVDFLIDQPASTLLHTGKVFGPLIGDHTAVPQAPGSDATTYYGHIYADLQPGTIQLLSGSSIRAAVTDNYAPFDPVSSAPVGPPAQGTMPGNYGMEYPGLGVVAVSYNLMIDFGYTAGAIASTPIAINGGGQFDLAGQAMQFVDGREAFVSNLANVTESLIGDKAVIFGTGGADIGTWDGLTLTIPIHSTFTYNYTGDFGGIQRTVSFTGQLVARPVVPEPSSFVLAALGLIGLVVWRRRKR
jgi:hypothetical protein